MRPLILIALSTPALAAPVGLDTSLAPTAVDGVGAHIDVDGVDLSVRLVRWGSESRIAPVGSGSAVQTPCAELLCAGRVDIERSDLTEWWRSVGGDLEHGFTVHRAPAGGDLVLDVAFDGATTSVIDDDHVRVDVGGQLLAYEGLVVWDATGRELDAWMEAIAGGVRLRVDAADAVMPIEIDPRLGLADWSWQPNRAESYVSGIVGIGDIDGDGYDDFAATANVAQEDGTPVTEALVFRGGAHGPSWEPEHVVQRRSGYLTLAGGDFNGDGYGDLAVGASALQYGTSTRGRVDVFHGGPERLTPSPQWYEYAEADGTGFGFALGVGDFNGDGYDDLIVGEWGYDVDEEADPPDDSGRVLVYHGDYVGLDHTPKEYASPQSGSRFGSAVAGAGDVDGDGYDEMLIGASEYTVGGELVGRAEMHWGTGTGAASGVAWKRTGSEYPTGSGFAAAGDVNGDGFADVLVGSSYYDEGIVELFLGSASALGTTPVWKQRGNAVGFYYSGLGYSGSMAGTGDFDGDGFDDIALAVGAWGAEDAVEGKVAVFKGGASGPSLYEDYWAFGTRAGAWLSNVANLGDVNGDGAPDLGAAERSFDGAEQNEGQLHAWFGTPGLAPVAGDDLVSPDVTLSGTVEMTSATAFGCNTVGLGASFGMVLLSLVSVRRRR